VTLVEKLKGRIKAGEGTLIGNAGEYYVVAELLKRGIVASLAPRNAPGFDVLATKGRFTSRIRVKTKSEQYDIWQWAAKPDGTIFRDLLEVSDFTVLVNLTRKTCDLEFFIVPTYLVHQWLTSRFERWLNEPGKNGRPHNPTNKKRHLGYREHAKALQPFRDNWDILWATGLPPNPAAPADQKASLPGR
jgi:hypothetical protein